MSGAIEVAKKSAGEIEELIADMLEGDHLDNEISLGRLLCGKSEIQVQLRITRNRCDFIEDEEDDLT